MTRDILSELVWIDGKWTSKNGDAGDGMSANAAMALVTPCDERVHNYVRESFVGDRPFRSPLHAADPAVDLERSFSRDHILSLCWYALFSKEVWPIQRMARYLNAHSGKIGAEGSYSQHGATPNVLWAMNAVCKGLPWYFRIWPSWAIALVQLASAKTVTVSYRLNLCAEMALIAKLTGQWNWLWDKVALTCVQRQPENLYYEFVAGRNPWLIEKDLAHYIETFEMSHEWAWCWMHKSPSGKLLACGQDLLLLKAMLEKN